MNFSQIKSILDHKYPYLLIDGVTEIEFEKKCYAYKNLTYNEWFFPAHFPNKPLLPGSIQIEIFTQAVALPLLINKDLSKNSENSVLLAGIDKVRFYKSVVPGDRLEICASIDRYAMGIANASVNAKVNSETVSECKITYKVIN